MPALRTRYLGLNLASPLVVAASPLGRKLESIRQLEKAGAGAVVLPSLFEEQIRQEDYEFRRLRSRGVETATRRVRQAPTDVTFSCDSGAYVRHLEQALSEVSIPIIPSLNGVTAGGWVRYARMLEDAGAPALEVNLYYVPTDPETPGERVENRLLTTFEAVRAELQIPLAVKLTPYFSNVGNMVRRFVDAGANALVLFNRFYQPDIDLEERTVDPHALLSTAAALRLPLRWIAMLSGRIETDFAASGGVLSGADVVRVVMAGAQVAQVCSVLLRGGVDQLETMSRDVESWLEAHGHERLSEIRGEVRSGSDESPAYERAHYIRAIQG